MSMATIETVRGGRELPHPELYRRNLWLPELLCVCARMHFEGHSLGPGAPQPENPKSSMSRVKVPNLTKTNSSEYHKQATKDICRLVVETVGNRVPPKKKEKLRRARGLVDKALGLVTSLTPELLESLKFLVEWRHGKDTCKAIFGTAERMCYAETSLFGALSELVEMTFSDRRRLVFQLLSWGDEMENRFKFLTAAWAARAMGQELPPAPKGFDGRWLYTGITGSRMRRFLDCRSENRRVLFFQAMLMAKRATAPVPESFINSEYAAHRDRLTSKPAPLPYWFAKEIERTVREVFPKRPFRPSEVLLLPSERAHFGRFPCGKSKCGVAEGGSFGQLVQCSRSSFTEGYSAVLLAQVLDASMLPDGLPNLLEMRDRAGRVVEIRGFSDWITDNIAQAFETGLQSREPLVYDPSLETADAEPSAVLEACKVRMITKGPVKLQWLGRYLQKFLWQGVKNHPTFRLIGAPLDPLDIDSFWSKCPLGSWWLSGDYKAATDYLSADASNLCWDAIVSRCGIHGFWDDLGRRLLTDHTLHYPLGGGEFESVKQTNGQLMGSVVSFPILCLVNAAVNRYVMEQSYDQEFSLLETGMLINGDDCLLHLPQRCYPLWQACTSAVGLKMSVGKNYFSDRFVVINSRTFVPRGSGLSQLFGLPYAEKVPFINPGNLHGVGRVLSQSGEEDSKTGFLSRCDSLVASARGSLRDELIDTWVYLNSDKLKEIASPGQSWFLPRYAGGLGLPMPSWFTVDDCSLDARKVMRYLCGLTGQEFLGGLSLETPNAPSYASRGSAMVGQWCERLGMMPVLVREEEYNKYQQRQEESASYSQFALWGYERSETTLKHLFQRCLRKARNIEPACGLPTFGRMVLRPNLRVKGERFDVDCFLHYFIHGHTEANRMLLDAHHKSYLHWKPISDLLRTLPNGLHPDWERTRYAECAVPPGEDEPHEEMRHPDWQVDDDEKTPSWGDTSRFE